MLRAFSAAWNNVYQLTEVFVRHLVCIVNGDVIAEFSRAANEVSARVALSSPVWS